MDLLCLMIAYGWLKVLQEVEDADNKQHIESVIEHIDIHEQWSNDDIPVHKA